MSFEFLQFRRVGTVSPFTQMFCIVALFILTTLLAYREFLSQGTTFGYPLSLSILFVPIYEEILFRGLILEYLDKHSSRPVAIVITSVLFAVWHLKNIFFLGPQHVVVQMLYAGLIVSPVLSWFTIRTRSIWPGVILHYIHNILVAIHLFSF